MSRITDGSGIPLSGDDRAKLKELGAELSAVAEPDTVTIDHYLALSLNNGELDYSLECLGKNNPNRTCVADTDDWFDGVCNYDEWLGMVGIESMHHGTIRLGNYAVEVVFVNDNPEMRAI